MDLQNTLKALSIANKRIEQLESENLSLKTKLFNKEKALVRQNAKIAELNKIAGIYPHV